MQIYPVTFDAPESRREFRFEVQAKKGGHAAVCRIMDIAYPDGAPTLDTVDPESTPAAGVEVAEEAESDHPPPVPEVAPGWSLARYGPGGGWVLTCEEPVLVPTSVRVHAAGSCGQISPWVIIHPQGGIDALTPAAPGGLQDKLATLEPNELALYELAKHAPIHPDLVDGNIIGRLANLGLLVKNAQGHWKATV